MRFRNVSANAIFILYSKKIYSKFFSGLEKKERGVIG